MDYYYDWSSDGVLEQKPVEPAASKTAEPTVRQKKEKKSRLGLKITALALACALLGGAAGAGGALLLNRNRAEAAPAASQTEQLAESDQRSLPTQNQKPDESADTQPANQTEPAASETVRATERENQAVHLVTTDGGQLLDATEVYERNVGSTVGITTEITTNYWGYQTTSAAAGSGFILTENGYILTNYHVIEKANTINVAMYDGQSYTADLVGYDESNDIAVLKIDAEGLTPVTLGNSDNLKVGQDVIAIGNPLGELTFSLTKGVVSALSREVTLSSGVTMNLIQTDCAINSGNSGGALFDLYGRVVGITNAKYSSSAYSSEASIDNIGFAIPINSVREIVTSIIEKGYISKPYIGVSVSNVSAESQSYGLPQGAAIRGVEEESPAAAAGLQVNDIITAVNGREITTYTELSGFITGSEIGDELVLTVFRQGESLTITVTIGEKIQNAIPETDSQSGQSSGGSSDPWGGQNPFGGDPFGWGYGFGG